MLVSHHYNNQKSHWTLLHQLDSNVFFVAFNQVNVWVFWFWFHLSKVSSSDSSVSGQNLLSGMLCSVLFLLLPLLNNSKHIKFWLWFHLCSVNVQSLQLTLKKMIFVVLSYILCLLPLRSSPGIQLLSLQQFAHSHNIRYRVGFIGFDQAIDTEALLELVLKLSSCFNLL